MMAITYTLTPLSMAVIPQHDGEENVVVQIAWKYAATDGVYVAENALGFTTCSYAPGSPFTPYSDLTEAQVAGWVLSSWTPEQTAEYQAQLADMLAEQKAAAFSRPPLPWAT